MTLHIVLARALVAGAVATAIAVPSAQRPDPEALHARLADPRPLDAADIDQVLAAVRARLGGKPFRFASEDGGFAADVLFERDGHVRYLRRLINNRVSFTEYTGRIARTCDGGQIAAGELVVEYRQAGSGWMVNTRESSVADVLRPIFDMLVGLKPLADEGTNTEGGRVLSVGWNHGTALARQRPGGGGGAGASTFVLADPTVSGIERLTIDPVSLRPMAWEFAFDAPGSSTSAQSIVRYRFQYDTELVLAPPAIGVSPPDCIDLQNPFSPR